MSIVGVLTFATFNASADDAAAAACVHTEFKTELVKEACTKGGQKEAKTVMKAFMKEKKIKSCNACHSKLAPKYELKPDGLTQFQKAGGK
jgi:NAD-dependent SIR2 family protein deacetylase